MKKPLKAFILAAGFGTRLRPLTNSCPKVLLPFFGVPLLFLLLEQLAELDVEEIFVNGHYLREQIQQAIDKYPMPIKVTFCPELEILGTAGAISAIKHRLVNCDLLVLNGDIVTDFNLNDLVNNHRKHPALATMGLLQRVPPTKTSVWYDEEKILAIGGSSPQSNPKEGSWACSQILSSEFLKEIPNKGPSEIIPIYQKLIRSGVKISYLASNPFWFDIGSPDAYFEAHMRVLPVLDEWIERLPLQKCWKKLGHSPYFSKAKERIVNKGIVAPFFSLKPLSLGKDSCFGPEAINLSELSEIPEATKIVRSILVSGALVEPGDHIEGAILSKDFQIDVMTSQSDQA